MRAFGQGSLSSLLKALLDVAVGVLAVLLAITAAALAAALLSQPFLGQPSASDSALTHQLRRGAPFLGLLALACVYWAALLVVAHRLRQLFATMIRGLPFAAENAGRLRAIGAALIVLQFAGIGLAMLVAPALGSGHARASEGALRVGSSNVSAWFSILVVFVLAEVFREGTRLQSDAELTV